MMSQPGNPGFFASARIMWQEFGIAFCLVLVLEGILPFLCPRQWREAVTGIGRLSDRPWSRCSPARDRILTCAPSR